jgi:hypothetical protein
LDPQAIGRDYEVIGYVSAQKTAGWTFTMVPEEEVVAICRQKAASLGAHAILLDPIQDDSIPWQQNSLNRKTAHAAALRFKEEEVPTPAP